MAQDPKTQHPAPRPPRLLVVSQHFWPELFRLNDMVPGFIEDGLEVDVLCGLPNYPRGEWFEGYRYTGPRREQYKGAQIFRSGEVRRKGNTPLRIFLNFVSFPLFALFSLPRLRGGYTAVFCYETSPIMMLLPGILYGKLHRIPITAYILDFWPDNLYSAFPVKSRLLRRLLTAVSNWHYRRCDRLVVLSDAIADRLRTITAKKRTPVAVIPQYSEDYYAEEQVDPAIRHHFEGRFTILFAGNISPVQDLETLVRAAQKAHGLGLCDLHCIILGDGMSREALQGSIEAAGAQRLFTLVGFKPSADIPKWTHWADALFAGLADVENLSLTVPAKFASYFAAGRPMLVAANDEAARAAQQSGAALVSPAGDSDALCENILQLYHMPVARRAELGACGKACYQTHYKRAALLRRMEDFVLQPGPAPPADSRGTP